MLIDSRIAAQNISSQTWPTIVLVLEGKARDRNAEEQPGDDSSSAWDILAADDASFTPPAKRERSNEPVMLNT